MNTVFLFAFVSMYRVMSIALLDKQQLLLSEDPLCNGLTPCENHSTCTDVVNTSSFCLFDYEKGGGFCHGCVWCAYDMWSIDGECPANCPATCQDTPPLPDKCLACDTEEECDKLLSSGVEAVEVNPWPICTDGSGRCEISESCRIHIEAYDNDLEAWLNDSYYSEDLPDSEYPWLEAWPAAGSVPCECWDLLGTCVVNAECWTSDNIWPGVGWAATVPAPMPEVCQHGIKCPEAQCAWIDALGEFLLPLMQEGTNTPPSPSSAALSIKENAVKKMQIRKLQRILKKKMH
jgi:hypothetical protein